MSSSSSSVSLYEHKHSTDIEAPLPPPPPLRVCMSIHPEDQSLMSIVCLFTTTLLAGDVSAMVPGGLRLGTPALTTRGFVEADFEKVADMVHKAGGSLRTSTQPTLNRLLPLLRLLLLLLLRGDY